MLIRILKSLWKPRGTGLAACYSNCSPLFEGGTGLELGGPSLFFHRRGVFPIYPLAARIDNCIFDRETAWGDFSDGEGRFGFDEGRAPGSQYISEATGLSFLPSGSYDFVLASHILEHVANPLRALSEWVRVLRETGVLALVLPHKEGTFDHRRPVTTLEHLMQDFEQQTTEADLTHLAEILELHDLALDPMAGNAAAFRERSERNLENRCLHHHVFDMRLAIEVVDHVQLQIHAVETMRPYHILIVAQKTGPGMKPRNELFTGEGAPCQRKSVFRLDRRRPKNPSA